MHTRIVLLVFLLSILIAGITCAEQQEIVTLQIERTSLRQAVEKLFEGREKTCYMAAGTANTVTVGPVSVCGVPFDVALKVILKSGGLTFQRNEQQYFIVPAEPPAATTNTPMTARQSTTEEPQPYSLSGQTRYAVTQILGKPSQVTHYEMDGCEDWNYSNGYIIKFRNCRVSSVENTNEIITVKAGHPTNKQITPRGGRYVGIYGVDPGLDSFCYNPYNPPVQFGGDGNWKVMTPTDWIGKLVCFASGSSSR